MTLRTVGGEPVCLMVRVCRRSVVRAVALVASRIDNLVVVAGVARLALESLMGSCQRKLCGAMVERRRLPRRG